MRHTPKEPFPLIYRVYTKVEMAEPSCINKGCENLRQTELGFVVGFRYKTCIEARRRPIRLYC